MAFCPQCRYEYQPGIHQCPDCKKNLVDTLPVISEPDHGPQGEDFIPLPEVDAGVYAEMVKGALDKRGIECYIHSEGFIDTLGVTGTGPTPEGSRVFVPASRFGECLEVQQAILSAAQEDE